MSLTVCCVWVKANVLYTAEYVERLKSMAQRNLAWPHDFVVYTDQKSKLPVGIDAIIIKTPDAGVPGWWSKLELFNKKYCMKGQGLYLDLDVLVVKDLMPIASQATDLTLIPHAGSFNGGRGREVVKKYNSSVMKFDFDAHHELYDECTDAVKHKLWGDQDWIGRRLPDQPTFPLEWFPRLSEIDRERNWPKPARVILCKRPKNAEAAERWPWFKELWQ